MKKFVLSLLLLCCFPAHSDAVPDRVVDSLKVRLAAATDPRERIALLLNLRDLTDSSPEELPYARTLFREACYAGDAFAAGSSLGSLASHYIDAGSDSLEVVLRRAAPLLKGSSMEGLVPYYRMVATARRIQTAPGTESVELCHRYVDSIASHLPADIYEEASQLFLKGIVAYKLASADGRVRMEKGLPFWSDEAALLPRMQPTARRNFHANLITCLAAAYSNLRNGEELSRAADDYLAMLDAYYADPEIVQRRPYFPREMSYLVCYYVMCTSPLLDAAKTQRYYDRYRRFRAETEDAGNLLTDPNGFYTISREYYERRGDWSHALAYNDSLIRLARAGRKPSLVVGMYERRARLLEKMGRYRDACQTYVEMNHLRDSLATNDYEERLGQLEVQYGLDKAERDKALLLAEKRKNSFYFAVVILLMALLAIGYLWRNLRRIERLQRRLSIESRRAQESDRMKRDFMGSMNHEIRTPLNAILGFSELIAKGDLSNEESRQFAGIIRDNTHLFTSLMNDMMEVAQLDNTSKELPKTQVDICGLLREEVARLPRKEGVVYRLSLPAETLIVSLHKGYVAMLIRALLNNAVKYTDKGSVTVACSLPSEGMLTFSVTDTGCGVAPEHSERIFERFFKGDPFAQGLGLGLSLCRLIAEKSGGSIRLDNGYTSGARFLVTLQV